MSRITVLGSGAWGTAIALSLGSQERHQVTLWAHRWQAAEAIGRERENRQYLPGFSLPASIRVTSDKDEAARGAEIVVCVSPSAYLSETMGQFAARMREHPQPGQVVVSATKGIQEETHLRMSEVVDRVLRKYDLALPVGVLSGPSFAQEVAAGMPTALTIAFDDLSVAERVQAEFSSEALRLYTSTDLTGVEIGGALKNVIAIAAGVLSGLGLGLNSAAGLITRGIAEMTRLAVAAGGQRETLAGLSGIGDLVLTCTGSLSRNRTVGYELGKGRSLPEILAGLDGKVAEGVRTTRAALGLAQKLGVEMPITAQMAEILDNGKSPREAIRELMLRPARPEAD